MSIFLSLINLEASVVVKGIKRNELSTIMKINGSGQTNTPTQVIRTEVEKSEKKAGTASVGDVSKAQISEAARMIPASDVPFNSEKVARIKQSIMDGTFMVNASFVADAMIGSEVNGFRR